jgi:hypothetical protein
MTLEEDAAAAVAAVVEVEVEEVVYDSDGGL